MYPVLFEIGPLPIRSWGVLVMLGFLAGLWIASREARRRGLDPNHILDFSLYGLIAALIGARLTFVLLDFSAFLENPLQIVYLQMGGMSIHGAVIGGAIAGGLFAWRYKIPFWKLANVFAPGLILGQAIGRIGCFLNGDSYGKLTDSFVGMSFEAAGVPGLRHPTQLYEMVLDLGVFAVLWVLRTKKGWEDRVFLMYLILYSVVRIGVEAFREAEILFDPVTVAQGASAVIIALALVLWWRGVGLEPAPVAVPVDAKVKTKGKTKAAKARG